MKNRYPLPNGIATSYQKSFHDLGLHIRLPNRLTILAWRDRNNPEAGGAEEYIVNIAERLVTKGFDVIFLTAGYKNACKEEQINGINYSDNAEDCKRYCKRSQFNCAQSEWIT